MFSDPLGLDAIRNFVSAGSFNDGDVFIYGGNTFVYNGELGIWARMDLLKEEVVTSNPRGNQPPLWNSWLMAFEGAREEYMRSAEEEAERQRLEESRKVSAAEVARLDANAEAMRGGQELGEQYQQQNGGDGWNTANTVVGATSVVPSTIEMGTVLIKRSANYTDDIAKVAKISSRTTTGLGVLSMVITTMEGATSKGGWKNHHYADLIIGGVQTFLLGTGPVGWGIGLVWLTADLITTGLTKKSITENLFD